LNIRDSDLKAITFLANARPVLREPV